MNKIKIFSLALSVFTTAGVAVAATTENGIGLQTKAELEPYFIAYANGEVNLNGMGKMQGSKLTHDSETGYEVATSRYTKLGFYGFDSYGSGDSMATFNHSDVRYYYDEIGEKRYNYDFDCTKFACFFNLTPIKGLNYSFVETVNLPLGLNAKSDNYEILYFFANHAMTPGNDPISLFANNYKDQNAKAIYDIVDSQNYAQIIAEEDEYTTGEAYYIMPDGGDFTTIDYYPDENTAQMLQRYMGSFRYFFAAVYGSVSIKSLSLGYSCELMDGSVFFK